MRCARPLALSLLPAALLWAGPEAEPLRGCWLRNEAGGTLRLTVMHATGPHRFAASVLKHGPTGALMALTHDLGDDPEASVVQVPMGACLELTARFGAVQAWPAAPQARPKGPVLAELWLAVELEVAGSPTRRIGTLTFEATQDAPGKPGRAQLSCVESPDEVLRLYRRNAAYIMGPPLPRPKGGCVIL